MYMQCSLISVKFISFLFSIFKFTNFLYDFNYQPFKITLQQSNKLGSKKKQNNFNPTPYHDVSGLHDLWICTQVHRMRSMSFSFPSRSGICTQPLKTNNISTLINKSVIPLLIWLASMSCFLFYLTANVTFAMLKKEGGNLHIGKKMFTLHCIFFC